VPVERIIERGRKRERGEEGKREKKERKKRRRKYVDYYYLHAAENWSM
jgi:hypothetical protein